jgi:hypothetical protein
MGVASKLVSFKTQQENNCHFPPLHFSHTVDWCCLGYSYYYRTTIIESLKFAVCGAFPPGNKNGQTFVHDPRSIGQSKVKANIKLRITNRGGKNMVIVRSMEVEQKKSKLTFKQLDGVLRVTDDDGNRQSLSHKCTELDKQIPLLLGVSKASLAKRKKSLTISLL